MSWPEPLPGMISTSGAFCPDRLVHDVAQRPVDVPAAVVDVVQVERELHRAVSGLAGCSLTVRSPAGTGATGGRPPTPGRLHAPRPACRGRCRSVPGRGRRRDRRRRGRGSAPPARRARPPRPGNVVTIRPGAIHALAGALAAPPTTAFCERQYRIACYLPAQLQRAYNLPRLYRQGITGRGQTIIIVDSFGSPTVQRDLRRFDRATGLPAPPSLKVIQPAGPVPAYPAELRPGGLGRRDGPGRRVRPRDRPRREHPARRDPDLGGRGHDRLPADRHGRGVRDQPPPRRRDQPELQRHRADLPVPAVAAGAARRLHRRRAPGRDRAGRLRRQRRGGREVQRGDVLPAPR